MIRIQQILYPTDFSSYSNQAYFHAVALAETHRASLTVLYVYTPDVATPGQPAAEAAARRYWQEQLEQIRPVDGGIAVRELIDRINWMRRFRGNAVYPIVQLSTRFMKTKFGGRLRPNFEIVSWTKFEPGSSGMIPDRMITCR